MCQVKFNRFLYLNEQIQRIFWYLLRLFESECSKICHFQSSDSIFKTKFHLIFLKEILAEYEIGRTAFIFNNCNFKNSQKHIQIWMTPTQKLNQNLLNFTLYSMKFHNHHHAMNYNEKSHIGKCSHLHRLVDWCCRFVFLSHYCLASLQP